MMLEVLKSTFGDCKFQKTSLCIGSYESTEEDEFYIFDPPNELNEPIRIVTLDLEHQLLVNNQAHKTINVVKTDKCLFTNDVSKCDCLLFNDEKFYIVEIKSSGKNTRGEQRNRAVEQLGSTLKILRDAAINLDNFSVKAVICFKSIGRYPVKTSLLSKQATFKEQYSVNLEEGNTIEF